MSLGLQVINELARRRELGAYFDYAGYRALRNIDNVADLSTFLRQQGYPSAPDSANPVAVVNWLETNSQPDEVQSILIWIAFDPFGGILALPLWLISRLTNRP